MKIKNIGLIGILPALLVGAGVSTSTYFANSSIKRHNNALNAKVVNEDEYIFEEERDMSYEERGAAYNYWSAKEGGNFGTFNNWLYSGEGYSFEFKMKNPSDAWMSMLAIFQYQDPDNPDSITEINGTGFQNKMYLFQINGTVTEPRTVGDGTGVGTITKLPLEDGEQWYRYELLFSELGNYVTGDYATVTRLPINRMSFRWTGAGQSRAYWNDMIVRKMKRIHEYSTPIDISNLIASKVIDGHKTHTIPQYKSFFNSNKVAYIDFYRANGVNIGGVILGDGTSSTGQFYILNNGVCPTGKIFPLGDDWYHWEVKSSALAVTAGKESSDLVNLWFNWGGTSGFEKVRSFGIYDDYSFNVTFNVGGETTTERMNGKITRPTDPVAPAGKHFDGWYSDDQYTNKYDFDTALTADTTLYGRFVDHVYEWEYDAEKHWKECECGDKIDEAPHSFTEEVVDDEFLKEPACCVSPAVYYKSCVCGCHSEETFTYGEIDPNNHVHIEVEMRNFVPATCETDGGYDEKDVCQDCGTVLEDRGHIVIPKTGHEYVEDSWSLSDDKGSGTLTLVCTHDSSHKVQVAATVTKTIIKEATTEENGLVSYTLAASNEGKNYSHVIDEVLPKIEKKGGCGGSIIATSAIMSVTAISLATLLIARKKRISKVK